VKWQLTVDGNCAGWVPFYNWLVSENKSTNCTWVDTLPTGPCPGGTLQESTNLSGSAVIYLARCAPGTFHAIGQALYYSNLDPATAVKQATSRHHGQALSSRVTDVREGAWMNVTRDGQQLETSLEMVTVQQHERPFPQMWGEFDLWHQKLQLSGGLL
jgi:hypothetical protein